MPRQLISTLLQASALYAGIVISTQCPIGYAPVSNGTNVQGTTGSKAIAWVDCPTNGSPRLQCGMLDVPIDYTDLSLGTLQMPVVRVPANASNPRNQSVIVNPGGPGGSGIQSFAGGSGDNIQAYVGTDFDLISFDPRGVGLNAAYLCPDKQAIQMAAQNISDIDTDDLGDFDTTLLPSQNDSALPETPEWFQEQFDAYKAFAEVCADDTYNLAGQLVGTAFVARDVDLLARSLGQDELIRYYGFSYGTLLGATIGAMFPDRIERMVLDGNINPSDYYYGLGDEAVSDFDPALEYFFNACAEAGHEHCELAQEGLSGQQLLNQYWTFYNSVRTGNTTTHDEDKQPVEYGSIMSIMQKMTFEGKALYKEGAKQLAIYYNNRDNTTNAAARKQKRDTPFNPMNAQSSDDANTNLLDAVTCGDGIRLNATNGESFREYMDAFKTHSKYGFETILSLAYSCGPWNISAKERPQKPFTNITTKNPILFVQGFHDPVTPSISAKNSSAGFVGSAIAFHNGTGHCAGRDPSKDLNTKIAAYFNTGEIPANVSDVSLPDSLPFTDATHNKRHLSYALEDAEDKAVTPGAQRFQQRMAGLDRRGLPKREVEQAPYPEMLRNAKRDVYEALLQRNEMMKRAGEETTTTASDIMTIPTMTMSFSFDVPTTCTPIASSSSSSTSTAVSGQGQSGAAAPRVFGWSLLSGIVLLLLGVML
ncbi:Tripeptidyl aminopeptidase [Cyphellophora attinorum]|uniref:Tripeptidyl aminopeptidase n=1 Tax=Cyphellophora attinorum TaxID=1664694 RepID=A0A0N1H2E5_9EURO|nr:Tripeptidyl aminopeptidase [Phialophora attinorum]KPI34476.1 Tripeptidyl aminopeptidase [Phialophora attinorum]